MDALIDTLAEQPWMQPIASLPDNTIAVLYFALLIIGAITQPIGRRLWTGPKKRQLTPTDDPFAIAYVTGGVNRSVALAFMMLSAHGLIQPSSQQTKFVATPPSMTPTPSMTPANLSDVEIAALTACKTQDSSIKSVARGAVLKELTTSLEKRALASGLISKKPPLALRALWASPILAAALLAGLRTITGIHSEQAHAFVLIAAIVAAGVWLVSLNTSGQLTYRRLFPSVVQSHRSLTGAVPVTGAPSAQTYSSLKNSPLPTLAGLGGIAAVSSMLLFWSPSHNELLLAAEKASLASSSSGSSSDTTDSGDSGGGDGGGCGGCGGCG